MSKLTRRDFLRIGGGGLVGAVFLDAPAWAQSAQSPHEIGGDVTRGAEVAPAALSQSPWRQPDYQPRPGAWRDYLLAPRSRLLRPASVLFAKSRAGKIQGDPENILQAGGGRVTLECTGGRTGSPLLAVDFGQEVGGRVILRVVRASTQQPALHVSFSESQQYMALDAGQNDGEARFAPGSDTANFKNGYPGMPYTWDSDSHQMTYAGRRLPAAVKADQLRGGFRYATIFLDGPGSITLDSLAVEFVAAPEQEDLRDYKGHFLCSDHVLNKVWFAGAYTIQLNTSASNTAKSWPYRKGEHDQADAKVPHAKLGQSVIFDGAKRDRIVWQGDLSVQAAVSYLSSHDLRAVENSLSLLAAQQLPDGFVPAESLVGPHNLGEERHYGEYVSWYVYNMAEHYLYTADDAYLDRWYSCLKNAMGWFESIRQKGAKGLISLESSGSCGHYGYDDCGHETYINALYFRNLNQMAKLAAAKGEDVAKRNYLHEATGLKESINRELWDDAVGAYRLSRELPGIYPQDAQAAAILAGVADKMQARRALAYLKARNWAKYGSLTVPQGTQGSPIPAVYEPFPSGLEVEARLACDDTDLALQLVRTFWGYQLSKDPQSTLWEKVGLDGNPAIQQFTSLAHGWAAGPTVSLTTRVLGVRPTEAGFSHYEAVPHPGDLTWAEGKVPTPHGPIEFQWTRSAHGGSPFTEHLKAPPGSTGRVGVPTFGRKIRVFMDGGLTWDGEFAKAHDAHSDGTYVYLEGITGGPHEISSQSLD